MSFLGKRNDNVIIVCLDGIGAPWLGPYGNTWYETPFWNKIASEGLLFEFAYSSGPHLDVSYRDYWSSDLAKLVEGRRAALLADDADITAFPEAASFGEVVLLELEKPEAAAEEIEQMQVAQSLAAAANWIADADESPLLLWLHVSALASAWDAPHALRCLAADEDDPEPPSFVDPPNVELADDYDPDELLGYMQAHAGQVSAIDAALDAFVNAVESMPAGRDAVIVFTSPRGYALGEHGRVGGNESLHGELLQVPCIVRFPQNRWAAQRSERLFQPSSLLEFIQAWDAGEPEDALIERLGIGGSLPDKHRIAFCRNGERFAVRTPSWFLAQTTDGGQRLYAKPDDRWEVNEVSDRCPDIVDQLSRLIEQFKECEQSGDVHKIELPPELQ